MLRQLIKTYLKFICVKLPFAVSAILLVGFIRVSAQSLVTTPSLSSVELGSEMKNVLVIAPEESPSTNQESIDAAIEIFSVDVPEDTQAPQFDKNLYDRGLTTGNLLGQDKTISIGPAAFSSWGILGSTIGHEAEIHARQSFLKIVAVDKFFQMRLAAKRFWDATIYAFAGGNKDSDEHPDVSEGTLAAEREAYMFELGSSNRFGLTHAEQHAIEHVMNTYYK